MPSPLPVGFRLIPTNGPEFIQAVALREAILRTPLGLSYLPEELEQEKSHIQIARFVGDCLCATAVLVPEEKLCKLQRVVVDVRLQGQGIGKAMMQFCEAHAKELGSDAIYCHARDTAVPFYQHIGYGAEGEPFDEDTVPHQKMRKAL